jgi:N-acetyl-1-D-myo-inositol-2-amino-2-deoxy-alpha-D-glucopyranoside deacetylase
MMDKSKTQVEIPMSYQEVTMQYSLLASFAHPDDEAFGTGGTIARYAQQGVQVDLVCSTRGEAGEIAEGSDATPETLGAVRERAALRG